MADKKAHLAIFFHMQFSSCLFLDVLYFPGLTLIFLQFKSFSELFLQEDIHTHAFLSIPASVTDLVKVVITCHLKMAMACVFGLLPAHPICPPALFFLKHVCSHNIPLLQPSGVPIPYKKVPAHVFGPQLPFMPRCVPLSLNSDCKYLCVFQGFSHMVPSA